jgi:hypothetical protein
MIEKNDEKLDFRSKFSRLNLSPPECLFNCINYGCFKSNKVLKKVYGSFNITDMNSFFSFIFPACTCRFRGASKSVRIHPREFKQSATTVRSFSFSKFSSVIMCLPASWHRQFAHGLLHWIANKRIWAVLDKSFLFETNLACNSSQTLISRTRWRNRSASEATEQFEFSQKKFENQIKWTHSRPKDFQRIGC